MTHDLSHLAFFLPSLRGGGAERVILDIAREFSTHIARVDLILVEHTGIYAAEDPGNVNVINLNAGRSLASIPSLARYLRRARPQALISALPHANIAAIFAAGVSRTAIPIIISERSMMSRHVNPGFKVSVMLRAMRLLYPQASQAIAISEQVREDMIQGSLFPRDRSHVVHNPLNLFRIGKLRIEPPKHPWLLNKTTPVVVTAGRLVDEKDQRTLLRALAIMSQTKARLVIFGEGPLREPLEDLCNQLGLQNRVDMPGFVSNPYAEFARADVLALPSKSEGFANVVIEALACSLPVVAMRETGGIADSLEDGQAVRLVDIGDDRAMATALDEALKSPINLTAMQSIVEKFSIERGWERYRDVVVAALAVERR